jgi:GNAT superfamily N-acetyltransferase
LRGQLSELSKQAVGQSWKNGSNLSQASSGISLEIKSAISQKQLLVATELVSEEMSKFSNDLTRSIRKELLSTAIGEKTSQDALKSISDKITTSSTAKLKTIMDTELMTVFNSSNKLTQKEISEVVPEMKKFWLSIDDGHSRVEHIIAGEQYSPGGHPGPIPVDEDFIVGGEACSGPQDYKLSAWNRIKCRCVSALWRDDWEKDYSSIYDIPSDIKSVDFLRTSTIYGDYKEFVDMQKDLFHRPLSPEKWGKLVGAPMDSSLEFRVGNLYGLKEQRLRSIRINVKHPVFREGASEWYTFKYNREPSLYIANLFINPEYRGIGVGTLVIGKSMTQAQILGFRSVELNAGGPPSLNGYYTWARLGFDAPIPPEISRILPLGWGNSTRISDILKRPGGKEWWRQNGIGFDGSFNLSPGSLSWDVLNGYLRGKGVSRGEII